MPSTLSRRLKVLLCAVFAAGQFVNLCQAAGTVTVIYPNFSSTSGLNLVSAAATTTGFNGQKVLRLTPAAGGQFGATWSTSAISFASSTDTFSTFFQFQITSPGGLGPADGIVFALQTNSNAAGGTGGSIGFGGIPNSVGIEFDTWQNGWDPNNNHVGIDVNGVMTSIVTASPYGVTSCSAPVGVHGCLANGDLWSVWIDYNGTTLSVAVADASTTRPADLISQAINIPCVLGGGTASGSCSVTPSASAFVGFTSGTGAGWENHDIVNWQYTNTLAPISGPPGTTPTTPLPSTLLLLAFGLAAVAAIQGRARIARLLRVAR